jgi:uncharacterized protein with ParB-like and HNH nuclease domain
MSSRDSIQLIEAADRQIASLRTQGKDYSFNELLNMYVEKELVINPEFQRLFRWSEAKESQFIESLILELPLPPIFVIEIDDGKYELIDGLQRFSSYMHFRGQLESIHRKINIGDYLTLEDCDIVKELNGLNYMQLPVAFQIRLKRHTVRAEIIRNESDKRLRYHMFKRLNTGGEPLSEQEIRNCTIRLLDNIFNQFVIDLSATDDFVECISGVGQDRLDEKYDQELVLRFFTFKNWGSRYRKDVGSFLTQYLESVTDKEESNEKFNYEEERSVFLKTFRVLRNALASQAFAQVVFRKSSEGTYPFTVYQFESFSLGIQEFLGSLDPDDTARMRLLGDCCWEIKRDAVFQKITTGGGKNTKNEFDSRVNFVRNHLRNRL